jgi:hypothetical protein
MHVMVQQILHVCLRHLMHPTQRHAIHAQRLGKIFQRLCSKITDPIDIPSLKLYILEMFAYWRAVFFPSFLDIMEHLLMHVVDEVGQCDLVIAYGVIQ